MDKFFIQAAFKSLDEIDLEENKQIKQALLESRLNEKKKREAKLLAKGEHLNVCAGNPDVNTAAFNHATDVGASSPSTGLGEAVDTKYKIKKYGNWHYIIINPENGLALRTGNNVDYAKPQTKDNKILFFKSKDEAQKYIDEHNLNKEDLDEKLPKDLAKAYKNSDLSKYGERLSDNPDLGKKEKSISQLKDFENSNISPVDFENASYEEISKEDALKYAKPKTLWKLVLLFKTGNIVEAIRFDKKGKALNQVELYPYYKDKNGKITKLSTQMPINELINRASKIYLTDEQEHVNDKYFKDSIKVNDPSKNYIFSQLGDPYRKSYGIENNIISPLSARQDIDNKLFYLKKQAKNYRRYFKDYEKLLKGSPESTYYKENAEHYLKKLQNAEKQIRLLNTLRSKQISYSEYAQRQDIEDWPDPKYRITSFNTKLAQIKLLKGRIEDKLKDFEKKSDTYLKGDSYKDTWEYRYYTRQIQELENKIKEIQAQIDVYNKNLSSLEREKIDDQVSKELENSYELIKDLNSQLTSLGAKSKLKEEVEKTKFNLNDPDDVKEAIERKENPEKEEDLVIIHPMLDHKKPQPGNAILTCKDCNEVFYFDKNELKQDEEDPTIYNKDIQCQNCGAQDGYEYIGDVSLRDTESAQEAVKDREDIEHDDFVDEEEPKEESTEKEEINDLEPVDTYEEPDEVVEESFDKLANKYFNKIYENISSYKTTNISLVDRNKYLVEGVLTDKNNKEEKISFLLETLKRNKDKLVLTGQLKGLIESKAPFKFIGTLTGNKLLFESMRYRYVNSINNDKFLVEGFERNK